MAKVDQEIAEVEFVEGISRKVKLFRTGVTIASWVSMGLYSEVSGPTLPDIQDRVQCNYEEISRVLVARSIGFLIGAFIGGILCDRFMRLVDLWLALALASAAIGTAAAPWCRSLELLGFMFSLDGLGKGITASASSAFILQLWGEKATVPTHCLHFSFGIGALIIPQIARPFLPPKHPSLIDYNVTAVEVDGVNHTDEVVRSIELTNSTSGGFVRREGDRIEVAYGIAAALTMLNALAFLVLLFCFPRPSLSGSKKRPSFKQVCNPFSCIKGDRVVGICIIIFLFLFWGMPIGAERAYGKFIFTYAINGPIEFSKSKAAILETIFWTAFMIGRFLAIILSNFISPTKLIIGDLVMTCISSSLLAAFLHNEYVLWICTAAFASVISPVFPASISWANLYIEMTPMATSVAFISSASADFAYSWIAGWLFEYKGPPSLMYFMVVYAGIISVLFSILVILGHYHKSKISDTDDTHKQEEVLDVPKDTSNGKSPKEVEMTLIDGKK